MVVESNYSCVRAPRLRRRVEKGGPRRGPELRSATCKHAVAMESDHSAEAGGRPAPAEPQQRGKPIHMHVPPRAGLAPRSHPNPQQTHSYNQRPALTPGRPFGRSSAQYSFYVPRRTSHSVHDLSRRTPSKVHQLFRGKTKRPTVQWTATPDATLPQRLHDAGAEAWRRPWNVRSNPSELGAAPRGAAYGTPSCARVRTRYPGRPSTSALDTHAPPASIHESGRASAALGSQRIDHVSGFVRPWVLMVAPPREADAFATDLREYGGAGLGRGLGAYVPYPGPLRARPFA
jgi:hypothetical protein